MGEGQGIRMRVSALLEARTDSRAHCIACIARQTVFRDLHLLVSKQTADVGCKLLVHLGIAGNWAQLKQTRDLLSYSSSPGNEIEPNYVAERDRLLEKIFLVARTMLSVDNSQSDMSSPLRGLRGQVTGRPVLKKRVSANLDDLNGPPSAIGSSSWKKRNEAQINAMSERIAQMEECLFKVLRGADKPRMMPEVGCRLLAPGGLVAVVERVASLPQTKSGHGRKLGTVCSDAAPAASASS